MPDVFDRPWKQHDTGRNDTQSGNLVGRQMQQPFLHHNEAAAPDDRKQNEDQPI